VLWRRIASDRALRVARRLRLVHTGEMVCIPSCRPLTYHLFLSHVQRPRSKLRRVVFAARRLSTTIHSCRPLNHCVGRHGRRATQRSALGRRIRCASSSIG
jgi:hypothetical protein